MSANFEGVPPHDLRTERALLGSMLLLDAAILDAIERVDPIDFYDPRHQTIFAAIAEVYGRRTGVDAISVTDAIERSGQSKTNDYEYLLELQADTVKTIAYSAPADVPAALDEAEATITAAIDERTLGDVAHVGAEIEDVVAGIYNRSLGLEEIGVKSGLTEVDRILGGFRSRQLVVVGARPAMGKTALAIELAIAVAKQDKPVLFTSLEMGRTELQERFIATMSMVGARKKQMGDAERTRMERAAAEIRTLPIEIDENPAASVLSIKANARRVARRNNGDIGMVIVDYLQLMAGRLSAENRQVEVAEMSRQLKALAGELGCPVVALSQLSRNVENRMDKRPMNKTPTSSCSSTETRSTTPTLPLEEPPKSSSPNTATAQPAPHDSPGWPTSPNSATSQRGNGLSTGEAPRLCASEGATVRAGVVLRWSRRRRGRCQPVQTWQQRVDRVPSRPPSLRCAGQFSCTIHPGDTRWQPDRPFIGGRRVRRE